MSASNDNLTPIGSSANAFSQEKAHVSQRVSMGSFQGRSIDQLTMPKASATAQKTNHYIKMTLETNSNKTPVDVPRLKGPKVADLVAKFEQKSSSTGYQELRLSPKSHYNNVGLAQSAGYQESQYSELKLSPRESTEPGLPTADSQYVDASVVKNRDPGYSFTPPAKLDRQTALEEFTGNSLPNEARILDGVIGRFQDVTTQVEEDPAFKNDVEYLKQKLNFINELRQKVIESHPPVENRGSVLVLGNDASSRLEVLDKMKQPIIELLRENQIQETSQKAEGNAVESPPQEKKLSRKDKQAMLEHIKHARTQSPDELKTALRQVKELLDHIQPKEGESRLVRNYIDRELEKGELEKILKMLEQAIENESIEDKESAEDLFSKFGLVEDEKESLKQTEASQEKQRKSLGGMTDPGDKPERTARLSEGPPSISAPSAEVVARSRSVSEISKSSPIAFITQKIVAVFQRISASLFQ